MDLGKKQAELESISDYVINKIPDLCMPSAYRWAGEDDYFNKTCSIRLIPYRKQEEVERCLTPNLNYTNSSVVLASRGSTPEVHEESLIYLNSRNLDSHQQKFRVTFGRPYSVPRSDKRAPSSNRSPSTSAYHIRSSEIGSSTVSRGKNRVSGRSEVKDKYEKKKIINRHYSRIHLRHHKDAGQVEDYRVGYDRLFTIKADESYPFANPMPACMLTENNIDNLREIIVSSVDIEWKMLTPVRPDTEYEESYFDKLVQLHRNRYSCRYMLGYYSSNYRRSPFVHTRHTYLVQQNQRHNIHSPMSWGFKLKHRFGARHERLKSIGRLNVKLTIPTLTLTSEESGSELIEDFNEQLTGEDSSYLNYESFSRYSKRNSLDMAKSKSERTVGVVDETCPLELLDSLNQQRGQICHSGLDTSSDPLEEQVESIVSHLMSVSL